MNIRKICFVIILLITVFSNESPGQQWYWIGFTDKAGTPYSTSRPEEFLSDRSIQRRLKQGIAVDETDLPVNPQYVDSIVRTGVQVVHRSKWLNGITVRTDNEQLAGYWMSISFVREAELTKHSRPGTKSAVSKLESHLETTTPDTSLYGPSVYQISQVKGHYLHQKQRKGEGKVVAVLDAGFYDAPFMTSLAPLFVSNRILGTKDFVDPESDIYKEHPHGMMVLSVMGGYQPGYLVGTAPEASFWLIRTEDDRSEFLIEEDNWVAGAEFADSVGADIINSSLGYYEFDDPAMNHTHADMDGATTRVTRGAEMAASKGMLVFSSAGNEALNPWRSIIAPADGPNVIAVGAVDRNRVYAPFSSVGMVSGDRVKPNLSAMGRSTVLQTSFGSIATSNGTSFSSPLLAGIAASLWQNHPDASAQEIFRALMYSGHQFNRPDELLGYGIPDLHLADMLLQHPDPVSGTPDKRWLIFPNPFREELTLFNPVETPEEIDAELLTLNGRVVYRYQDRFRGYHKIREMATLPPGLYLLRIRWNGLTEVHKISKTR